MSRLLTATLKGSARERGRAHGERFKAEVRESGILDYYLGYCERLLNRPGIAKRLGISVVHELCARAQSDEARGLADGFCEATGLDRRAVGRALVMPDALNFLVGLHAAVRPAPAPALGCTSVAAWGPYTAHGRLLFARNLDFAGNGVWDKFPVLARHEPDHGLPYVAFTTAGGILDGITGVNAEGLTLALHQHLSWDVSLWGTRPVLDLGQETLRTCRTIEEAIELISNWPTTGGWTVVLTHWKSRQACAIERTARRCFVHFARDGWFVRANDYEEPALKGAEIEYTPWRGGSRARVARAQALLQANKGRLDAAAMASILRDHLDSERGVTRAFAQTIAGPSNMTSVVIDAEAGEVWAAEGPAPVCEGSYRRLKLWEDSAPGEELAVPTLLTEAQRAGYQRYMEALLAWERSRDEEAAAGRLGDATTADPHDPIYRYMRGFFCLRAGDARAAAEHFESGIQEPDLPHRTRAQRLWLARSLDALGRRDEALRHYAAVSAAEGAGRPLGAAAERGARAPYRLELAREVLPDLLFGDVYAY